MTRRFCAVVAVGALALSLAACGSSTSNADADNGSSGAPKQVGTLKVVLSGVGATFGAFFIAQTEGLFEKNGVNVDVVNYQGNAVITSLLLSGGADVAIAGAGSLMSVQSQGQPIVDIFNFQNYSGRIEAVFAKPGIKSIADLVAMGSSCKLATQPPGQVSYGWANLFQKAYGTKCQLVNYATVPAGTALLTSGGADALVTQVDQGTSLVTAGKANLIFDPVHASDADVKKIYPGDPLPYAALSGVKSNLEGKRDAVTAFVTSLRQAQAIMEKSTPEQMADLAGKQTAAYGTTPAASILAGFQAVRVLYPTGPSSGEITEDSWKKLLDELASWGGPTAIDPKNPNLVYSKTVDMSYFNAAKP